MRLGAPVFLDTSDPQELVRAHERAGYNAAFSPDVDLADNSLLRAVRRCFERADVVIAEVGGWSNLLDPDHAERRRALDFTCQRLALADELGARCCVNTLGSLHPTIFWGPHPDNFTQDVFDASVENARAIVDGVKPKRAKLAFEMCFTTWMDSPENTLRVIKAIDRPEVAAHLDPVNLVSSPRAYADTSSLINRCFDLLGPYIVSCHAKDITYVLPMSAVHLEEVPPGQGVLDYRVYLSRLAGLGSDVPLLIEHLSSPEEYERAADHIRAVGAELGIALPEKSVSA